jgi:hypothetical protein
MEQGFVSKAHTVQFLNSLQHFMPLCNPKVQNVKQ